MSTAPTTAECKCSGDAGGMPGSSVGLDGAIVVEVLGDPVAGREAQTLLAKHPREATSADVWHFPTRTGRTREFPAGL